MDITPILIVGIIFASIVAVIVGPGYLKSRERREMQETVRRAIDKGQPLPPEVIDAMSKDVSKNLPSRTKDIRRGIIWTATGIGIAAQHLDRIFDPFAQADASTTRQFGGTGLGTTISRQLVELMGGTVGVRSTPGEGSSFHFTVP